MKGQQETTGMGRTPERLLTLIDREVDRLRADARGEGWTPWALLAGLLAVLAAAAALWEQVIPDRVSAGRLAAWVLLLSLLWDTLSALHDGRAGRTAGRRISRGARFLRCELFSAARGPLLVDALRGTALVLLAIVTHPMVGAMGAIAAVIRYGLSALGSMAVILSSASATWIAPRSAEDVAGTILGRRTAWIFTAVGLLSWVLLLTALLLYARALLPPPFGSPLVEARLASMAVIALVLVQKLVDGQHHSPVADVLTTTRRELLMGRISLDEGYREVDVALHGASRDDLVQADSAYALTIVKRSEDVALRAGLLLEELRRLAEKDAMMALGDDGDGRDRGTQRGEAKARTETGWHLRVAIQNGAVQAEELERRFLNCVNRVQVRALLSLLFDADAPPPTQVPAVAALTGLTRDVRASRAAAGKAATEAKELLQKLQARNVTPSTKGEREDQGARLIE